MTYIPYPKWGQVPGPHESTPTAPQYSTFKKLVRTVICGACFAIPFCVAIPTSPLMALTMNQEAKKQIIPRMMSDFAYVTFIGSTLGYWFGVEPFTPNPRAKDGFMPYLGPVTAEIPALSCLVASHLYFPGTWALINEANWKERRRVFVRLNAKCFFAFGPVHIPAALLIGVGVGVVLYPFKFFKLRAWRRQLKADHQL